MIIHLIRHGETGLNAEKRYQGRLDDGLSEWGRARLQRADFQPRRVYVSPARRARQTAGILFPDAQQIVIPELREMDFGVFEGRNFMEMEQDAQYRDWVEGGCLAPCPGGEGKKEFSDRVCAGFSRLMEQDLGGEALVIVAHGGTQMALLERYGDPPGDFYSWHASCGEGYLLEGDHWMEERRLRVLGKRAFTK